ncbi:hypothetical protein [Acetatifactor muris]|uniref:hypothetical protein n=1 Tax=Acetatifactor muris TaxID=879566 RepID=UPI0023F0344C|nr:hypothetical protein [Acetatifactor muris]
MEKHYQKMVADTQDRVVKSLQMQISDRESPRYGGFADPTGIVQAKFAIYRIASMVAVYCNEDTRFYRNGRVFESIMTGLDYVSGVQHENGLFDYITCNFFSAPDTAFCIKKLLPVYQYLKGRQERTVGAELTVEESGILEKVESIVRRGAYGLLQGGFHTPNHRWAIASILMSCSRLFDCEEMEEAAFAYLNEGIDCNEDGEFAEKSAGNYNRINNDAMILLSEATGDPSYERNAVRNLRMMLTYWEPDDSIFTANSTRFDRDRLVYPGDYYIEYLKMGMKYDIPEFLQMCNTIFEIVDRQHINSPDFLIWFMLHPEYRSFEFTGSYHRPDFETFYQESGIARGQQGRFTYTVMNGKSNFLYLHNGSMKLEMKVAGSFCEHRAFQGQQMERVSRGEYHLSQTMRGWYYLPFAEKPFTSDWWKMDNASREKKLGPDMQIDVWVKEVKNGLDVRVKTSGVEGAPWRIELAFSGVDFLTNEYVDLPLTGSEVIVVKQGYTEVGNGRDALVAGPCFGEHHFTEGKEDSEAKTAGAATLYLTAYTPFDREIQIRDRMSQYQH